MSKPRDQMNAAEVAAAQAVSMERFYDEHEHLRCAANTHLIRAWARDNMPAPVLISVSDIEWVASQLDGSLAVIDNEPEPTPVVPPPSYEERFAEHRARLESSDPVTLRKISLVQTLRNSGYTAQQISVELRSRNFTPLTPNEEELLHPPTPTNEDVEAVQKSASDEVSAASLRIGQLAGLGRPITPQELKALPVQTFKRLIWPHGPGTRKSDENERLIDLVLGGSR